MWCRHKLLLLYKAYFAAYASGLWMLVFWDAHKSDYGPMALHHVATLVLVGLSYHLRCAEHCKAVFTQVQRPL